MSDERFDDAAAVPDLLERLAAETDPAVRAALVDAVGRLGSGRDVKRLHPYLVDEDPTVRATAAAVLERRKLQQRPVSSLTSSNAVSAPPSLPQSARPGGTGSERPAAADGAAAAATIPLTVPTVLVLALFAVLAVQWQLVAVVAPPPVTAATAAERAIHCHVLLAEGHRARAEAFAAAAPDPAERVLLLRLVDVHSGRVEALDDLVRHPTTAPWLLREAVDRACASGRATLAGRMLVAHAATPATAPTVAALVMDVLDAVDGAHGSAAAAALVNDLQAAGLHDSLLDTRGRILAAFQDTRLRRRLRHTRPGSAN